MSLLLSSAPVTSKPRKEKAWSWSYSKLKNFEQCAYRHFHHDVLPKGQKIEDSSEQLTYGNDIHKIMELYIKHGTAIPEAHVADLKHWGDKARRMPGTHLVEGQLAIDEDFVPVEWFSDKAWFRAKIDFASLNNSVAVIQDWKTGKVQEDSVQLILSACVMFYHYPQLQKIRSMFVWFKEDCETIQDISRHELPKVWAALWPRIEAMKQAHQALKDHNVETAYPPTPNYLCANYCRVLHCRHNGNFRPRG